MTIFEPKISAKTKILVPLFGFRQRIGTLCCLNESFAEGAEGAGEAEGRGQEQETDRGESAECIV